MFFKYNLWFSIFIIWLFTISGIIGILNPNYTDWFLSLTPLNLALSFVILVFHTKPFQSKYIFAFSIPFCIGFITEALGVNYGLIFGTYAYGGNLGYKIWGVPIMICINWALLTAVTADVSKYISKHIVVCSIIGAAVMTALDVLLEISAPRFDFWTFENDQVPLQNYIGWFVTALVAHLGYQYFAVKTTKLISWHILLSIVVFFSVFIFL